jgi:hypothetical protein
MLTIHSNQLNSTFERIVRDKNGVLFRVRFIIENIDGRPQPRIVSAEAFKKVENKAGQTTLSLPTFSSEVVLNEKFVQTYFSKISPYLPLTFFMSQPTRAPSFR